MYNQHVCELYERRFPTLIPDNVFVTIAYLTISYNNQKPVSNSKTHEITCRGYVIYLRLLSAGM